MEIDTKVVGFFDKVEIQDVLLLSVGFDLGTIESQYMVADCVHRFHTEVVIVDTEIAKQVT
jgi:outer membrane receptor for monomeric catechols